MASPVRAVSNHYETLQVSPSATTEEIVEAFASHMRSARMRPDISVVRLAQLSVAYETLRDPAKRRTYDASIGLRGEPPKAPPNSPFIGAPVIARLNRIAEQPGVPTRREPPAVLPEPRVAAFIAASLREPTENSRPRRPDPISRPEPSPQFEKVIEPPSTPIAEGLELEEGRPSIGRTGATLAAAVIGVAILAFVTALPERNPDRLAAVTAQAGPGLTVSVPPATVDKDSFIASQPAKAMAVASASPRLRARSERAAPQGKEQQSTWLAVRDQQPAAPVGAQSEGQSLPAEAVAQQTPEVSSAAETPAAAADSAPVSAAIATMPLANATIARTIERIGYGCGRVVSATGVEGTSGAFNITCSSGDTYRAAPVRGRYHFRRTGSH